MQEFSIEARLMGCHFKLGIISKCEQNAKRLLKIGIDEILRIEHLLSEFLPDSQVSRINEKACAEFLKIDPECFKLIERCIGISKLTQGCFDITTKPLKQLYEFKNQQFTIPPKKIIKHQLKSIGYQKILLTQKEYQIYFSQKNMKISFAAIGKGYASDKVKAIWLKEGVKSGYINASGDLNAFGKKADDSQWKIGISNPDDISKPLLFIPINNASMATSGDSEQHFIYKGKRYSHNINPFTGLPLTAIKSVSVFSPSAELSDALATAIYVKGVKKGIRFINHLPHTHAIIIDQKNRLTLSKGIQYETC